MSTCVYLCLLVSTCVYLCLLLSTSVYLHCETWCSVYFSLLLSTSVYICLFLSTYTMRPGVLSTCVYLCLLLSAYSVRPGVLSTCVYLCLLLSTSVYLLWQCWFLECCFKCPNLATHNMLQTCHRHVALGRHVQNICRFECPLC